MPVFMSSMYTADGLWSSGDIVLYKIGIEIRRGILDNYYFQHNQVVKIIKYDKNPFVFTIEYNVGTKDNETIDLRIFNRNKFIRRAEGMGYTFETKERFKRKPTPGLILK